MSIVPFDSVDGHILTGFSEAVRMLGGDPTVLLARSGIEPEDFERGTYQLSYRQMVQLVALTKNDLQCPDFGMRLAVAQHDTIHSPLLKLAESCQTLGEALKQICGHIKYTVRQSPSGSGAPPQARR